MFQEFARHRLQHVKQGDLHVASAGPDKRHGTEDDIRAPEPPKVVADATAR